MRSYIAFVKKEFTENLRTFKLLIMGAVFLLFGMSSPVLAKFTPEIIKSAGLSMDMPAPTQLDSWTQFFKNTGQLGLLVLVILFCGIMANEFSRNTLVNILTKGMRRSTVILSKFTAATVIWTLSYLLSLAVCYGYTAYFWQISGLHHTFISFFSLWLYGVLLISLVILGGVLFKNIYGSLLLTGGAVVAMMLLNIVPTLQKYNPSSLAADNMALITASKAPADILPALVFCSVLIAAIMALSVIIFNKKQL